MRCHCCGRFFSRANGYAWKMIYSGHPPTPEGEIYKCPRCVVIDGPFDPDERIKPECSCGYKPARALVDALKLYQAAIGGRTER